MLSSIPFHQICARITKIRRLFEINRDAAVTFVASPLFWKVNHLPPIPVDRVVDTYESESDFLECETEKDWVRRTHEVVGEDSGEEDGRMDIDPSIEIGKASKKIIRENIHKIGKKIRKDE